MTQMEVILLLALALLATATNFPSLIATACARGFLASTVQITPL